MTTQAGDYVDLGGPGITLTVPPGATSLLVSVASRLELSNGADACYVGFAMSGDCNVDDRSIWALPLG